MKGATSERSEGSEENDNKNLYCLREYLYIVMHGKLGRYMNIEGASAEASEGNEETKKIIGH